MKLLREIFDQPYSFKKTFTTTSGNGHRYEFDSHNDNYGVEIAHAHDNPSKATVQFSSEKGGQFKSNAERSESHRIFSTVNHIIKHHLKQNPHIDTLKFSAAKPAIMSTGGADTSRSNLYSHMARKFTGVKKGEPNKHIEISNRFDSHFHVYTKDLK